ncbi:MAG: hypothetical protein IPH35_19725 [Rhodoferax sp.]|nr:hypothetical protein [Rhodoferax sp.]
MGAEHIVKCDDPKFIPLARRRVAAMRASGLQFGTQRFEMDNMMVTARISGAQSYVSVLKDSGSHYSFGIVDMGQFLFRYEQPCIFSPGKLWTEGGVDVKPKAFTAGLLSRAPPGDPPIYYPVDDSTILPIDEALVEKKWGAKYCPPSIFTGKCRLYIQSLMGSSLFYKRSLDPNAHPSGDDFSTSPRLALPGYDSPLKVVVDTSTGVIWDNESKKHWLFIIAPVGVLAYELVSDATSTIRQKFKDSDGTDEKLESLILSTSYPKLSTMQTLNDATTIPMSGAGHGWHWAWSTPVADMVVTTRYDQGGTYDGNVATHYRMTFTPEYTRDPVTDEVTATAWSCEMVIVSGPTQWSANRFAWGIFVPIHGTGIVEHLLPRYSHVYPTPPVPFYAFYKRDELCLCTFECEVTESETVYSDSNTEGYNTGWVLGAGYGEYSFKYTGAGQRGRFVVSGSGMGSTPFNKNGFDQEYKSSSFCTGTYRAYYQTVPYQQNYGITAGGLPIGQVGENVWNSYQWGYPGSQVTVYVNPYEAVGTFHNIKLQTTDAHWCQNFAIIPSYDAQAIYLYSASNTTHVTLVDAEWTSRSGVAQGIAGTGLPEAVRWNRPGDGAPSAIPAVETVYSEPEQCTLYTAVGSSPATIDSYTLLMMTEIGMEVTNPMSTTTGVNTSNPSIIAPGLITPVNPWGYKANIRLPIIVGWA